MSVLMIRTHRRYALRMPAKLQCERGKTLRCLLRELSQHGLRISNLGEQRFEPGDAVTLDMQGGRSMPGKIRWAHDGVAGMVLDNPLHLPEMSEIIAAGRQHKATQPGEARYGT